VKLDLIIMSILLSLTVLSLILFILAPYVFYVLFDDDPGTICVDECAKQRDWCIDLQARGGECTVECSVKMCTTFKDALIEMGTITFILAVIVYVYHYFRHRKLLHH
jgi:hypothetical protein